MTNLDLSELTYILSDLAKKLLQGQKINKTKVNVEVNLWEPLVDALEVLGGQVNLSKEQIVAQLVEEAFLARLNEGVKEVAPASEKEAPESTETPSTIPGTDLDLGNLTQGLEQLQQLAQQFGSIQQSLGNLNAPQPNKKNKKDY